MGIIGLSPNNFISPIDFVPGLGPYNKARKGYKAYKALKKSGRVGKLLNKGRVAFWSSWASVDAIFEAHIYYSLYQNRDRVRDAFDTISDNPGLLIRGGPMINRKGRM